MLLCLLCACHTAVLGQTSATVYGVVRSAADDEPVPQAEVYLNDTEIFATTAPDGSYRLNEVPRGEYLLIVVASGHKPFTQPVRVDQPAHRVAIELDTSNYATETIEVLTAQGLRVRHLRPVEGTNIYASKKSEVVKPQQLAANLAANNPRQIYYGVAGLNIWESDGIGLQLGIGARGLNPNRSSNFNVRQNGYDIAADALGYPESYYTPPAEALEEIQVVRGAAGLQYGTQFGGLVNFKFRRGPLDKKIALQQRLSAGSFGFFNSFTSLGGTVGKLNYYSFYQYRHSDGWRPNSQIDQHTGYLGLRWMKSRQLQLGLEYTHMQYLAQQPGGLTDALFEADPRQSIRPRNFFRVKWNLLAATLDYRPTPLTRVNAKVFGLLGGRDALGILSQINRADPGGIRDLMMDDFRNGGAELRAAQFYDLLGNTMTLSGGLRLYEGFTTKRQGKGPANDRPEFTYLNPENPANSSFDFPSRNLAFFAENLFRLTPQWSLTPGFRLEYIDTQSEGYYNFRVTDLAGNILLEERREEALRRIRRFALLGIGSNYRLAAWAELYANFAQNYRAVNFNDLRIQNPNFRVDPDLQDERGFNADLGLRGELPNLFRYDVTLFYLQYADRIGAVLRVDSNLFNLYRERTNIADSRTYGLESFLEVELLRSWTKNEQLPSVQWFNNLTVLRATYVNSEEAAYEGNQVEMVPPVIWKTGLNAAWRKIRLSAQYAYTAAHYTDATNADETPNAVHGLIPAYEVVDLSLAYSWRGFTLTGSINNLLDARYFTRRAAGYPGPGIIPADGRRFFLTLAFQH